MESQARGVPPYLGYSIHDEFRRNSKTDRRKKRETNHKSEIAERRGTGCEKKELCCTVWKVWWKGK